MPYAPLISLSPTHALRELVVAKPSCQVGVAANPKVLTAWKRSARSQALASACILRGRRAADHQRRVMAGSSHRKPPRDNLLRDTLLTLITPDSMKTAPVKARILGAEHELPTAAVVRSSLATPVRWRDNSALEAFGHQHGKWVAEADRKRWRV